MPGSGQNCRCGGAGAAFRGRARMARPNMSITKSLRLSVLATALAAGLAVGTIALLAQVFFPQLPDWEIVSFAALFGGSCAAVAAYFATAFLDSQFGAVDAALERERQTEHALRTSHAELESRLAEQVAE